MKKILTLIGICVLNLATVSCQKKALVLEYGNPIDLEKIDWKQQNLDTLFSRIVYSKEISYEKSDEVYKGNEPLRLRWKYIYNADTTRIANKINERHFKVVKPNENNIKTKNVYRSYIGVSNENLQEKGTFGYYKDSTVNFSFIETISNGEDEIEVLRLNQQYNDETLYLKLINILKEQYENVEYKSNDYQGFKKLEWKLDDKVITVSSNKGQIDGVDNYTMFLQITFINNFK